MAVDLTGMVDGASNWGAPTRAAMTYLESAAASINVLNSGAVGDGVTDDTAAIQSAINEAISTGIKRVFFPDRTFVISGSSDMLTASAGLEMCGPGTIKVKDANGPWNAMFNTGTADASGLYIHGLTWDGNATNNQPVTGDIVSGNYPTGARRIAIRADYGKGIRIEGNTFHDHDCTWVFISANSASSVAVRGNRFLLIGNLTNSALVHDHSTVYIDATDFEIAGNTFSAFEGGVTSGSMSLGAISSMDTHGPGQKVHENTTIGYVYAGQLSTSSSFSNVNADWHDNAVLNCGHGLHLVPYTQGLNGVRVHDNVMLLDFLTFRAHPWQNGSCGVSMNSGDGGSISNVAIENNVITWKQATHTGQSTIGLGSVANGVQWVRREAGATAWDRNVSISRNRITGAPDNGMYIRLSNADGFDIVDNVLENAVSTANADTVYSVALYADYATSLARPRVDNNHVRDTQSSTVHPYGNTTASITAALSLWSTNGYTGGPALNNRVSVATGWVKLARETTAVAYDPSPLRAGGDYMPEHTARAAVTMVQDTGYWVAIRLGSGAFTQAALEIVTPAAGSSIEAALYADANGRSGKKIYSLGTIDSTLSSWRATTAGTFPVQAGVYWLAFAAHGGTPGVRFGTGRNSLIAGPAFTGVTSTDLTGIAVASQTSLPSTAPTTGQTFGQGPVFYVVGA